MVYAICTDGMDADQLEAFEETIGQRVDPEKEALKALKAFQEAAGMVVENPDAPVSGFRKGADGNLVPWEAEGKDEEIPGSFMGM